MNISNEPSKVKAFLASHSADIFVFSAVILASIIGFGLGRFSALYKAKQPIRVEYGNPIVKAAPSHVQISEKLPNMPASDNHTKAYVVASKKGTRYYFPWCDGVERLSEKNKITFATEGEAQTAGYTLAANCR